MITYSISNNNSDSSTILTEPYDLHEIADLLGKLTREEIQETSKIIEKFTSDQNKFENILDNSINTTKTHETLPEQVASILLTLTQEQKNKIYEIQEQQIQKKEQEIQKIKEKDEIAKKKLEEHHKNSNTTPNTLEETLKNIQKKVEDSKKKFISNKEL